LLWTRRETRQAASLHLHSQLLYFLVVILAVEDRPLLRALDDGAALAFDFLAGGLVDAGFLHEELFENLADFEADGVAVLDEVDFIQFGHRVGDGMGEFVDFVAAQSHSAEFLKEQPCIFSPARSSPYGTFPGNWRRSSAFPRNRLRG